MSNIFGWIGQREQRDILQQVRKHMDQVLKVVGFLQEAVQALCNDDSDSMRKLCENLAVAEHEADILRRDLLTRLSHGLLLPPDRQDLVQLVSRMDDVADYAQGASRLMVILNRIPELLRDDLLTFASILVEAAGHLSEALEAIANGQAAKALDACTQVETIEEGADRLKAHVLQKLFNSDLPAGTLLLMHDLFESMENTADRAEDSADLVRVLTVTQSR